MKMKSILLAVAALMAATYAQAITVPLNQSIVTQAGDADNTIEYVFTDSGSGESVTVSLSMTPFSQTLGETFQLLDGNTRFAVGSGGDGNWMESTEGLDFTASVVLATANVNLSSIAFGITGIGLRGDGDVDMTWTSSATASLPFINNNLEAIFALDSVPASLLSGNYTAELRSLDERYQFSDAGAIAGLGLQMNTSFTLIPEPATSGLLLFGMSALFMRRKRVI